MAGTTSRIVLITGAAGGIGRAMVASLLVAGHRIAALDYDAKGLDALLTAHAAHPDLHAIEADLSTAKGCEAGMAAAVSHFGRVEVLVNNAGIGVSSLRPDINNTTSFRTMLRVLPYGATKAALEASSAVWAAELAGTGITVNVLIPGGPTDTPFIGAESGWARDAMLRPGVMGPPLAWLVSDAAGNFTGQRIIAARWDNSLTGAEAAARACRAIGWPELGADAVWLTAKNT